MPRHIYIYTNTGFHRTKEADGKKRNSVLKEKSMMVDDLLCPILTFYGNGWGLPLDVYSTNRQCQGRQLQLRPRTVIFKKAITYSAGY